jgi:hypothetical protein
MTCMVGLFVVVTFSSTLAQLQLGVYGAPAVQSLTIAGASMAVSYKPRLLPQAGILATYRFYDHFSARLGARWEEQGMRHEIYPNLGHDYGHYWERMRMNYLKATVGLGYEVTLTPNLALLGAVDFAYGIPMSAVFSEVEDGVVVVRESTSNLSMYNNYIGLDIGLGLAYRFENGMALRFMPTVGPHLNSLVWSELFDYKWVAFAPRIEFLVPLSKN